MGKDYAGAFGELVDQRRVHDLFTVQVAREAVGRKAGKDVGEAIAAFVNDARKISGSSWIRIQEAFTDSVYKAFDEIFSGPQSLRATLKAVFDERLKADYEPDVITPETATEAVRRAHELVHAVAEELTC